MYVLRYEYRACADGVVNAAINPKMIETAASAAEPPQLLTLARAMGCVDRIKAVDMAAHVEIPSIASMMSACVEYSMCKVSLNKI